MVTIPVNPDLSENVEYNNSQFPAYIQRGVLSSYPEYRAICHWHTDFEFIYVYDGSMDYSINGTIITLSAGQGLFVNSSCLHFGFSDTKSECNFLCILLHPSLLSDNQYFKNSILNPLTTNPSCPFILLKPSCTWQNNIIMELLRMEKSIGKENEALNIIQSFTNIIYNIVNHSASSASSDRNDYELSVLAAMIGYVQQNYTHKISIDTLSATGGCCSTTCNELFRKYLNMTPLTYITKYRLDKSIDMLIHSEYSISEIAYACGFSGSSYFCEIFHRYYGTSPRKYRRELS